ncbi:MAG TPA: ABC transporter permease [Candidatus Limnocylindrales bacterium]
MVGYITRRLLGMVLLLLVLTMAVFILFNLIPSDPARLTCGKICTPTLLEANRHRLGLDKPALDQYTGFVGGIFSGRVFGADSGSPVVCPAPCLGYSFLKHQLVTTLIAKALPVTFWLALGGFIIWIFTGLAAGIYAALHRGKWQDRTILTAALIGYSLPSFFIGLVLIFFVVLEWGLLPFPQFVPPNQDPLKFVQTMILPWIVIAVLNAAFYVRLTRNQVLETLGEDYVRTARAKGLRERTVVVKHALRAGLTPIVTAAGLDLAYLLGGAIITETIFSLPGLGALAVDSVVRSDLPVITGVTLISSAFIIFANLIVDLLYAVVDPRVRVG